MAAMSGMTFELDTPHGRMMAGIAQFERNVFSVTGKIRPCGRQGAGARNSAASPASAQIQIPTGSPATSASARTPSPTSSNGIGQTLTVGFRPLPDSTPGGGVYADVCGT